LLADVYSAGLVTWEVLRRTQSEDMGKEVNVDDWQLPFFDVVGSDPGFAEMRDVVCIKVIKSFSKSDSTKGSFFAGNSPLSKCKMEFRPRFGLPDQAGQGVLVFVTRGQAHGHKGQEDAGLLGRARSKGQTLVLNEEMQSKILCHKNTKQLNFFPILRMK